MLLIGRKMTMTGSRSKPEIEASEAWIQRWSEIVLLEPRLALLERSIRRVRDRHTRHAFCGTEIYLRFFAWRIDKLCGGEAPRAPAELRHFWTALDIHDYLLECLPSCRNCQCCDSKTDASVDRNFSGAQRAVLYDLAGGRCAVCGVRLRGGWHADHIKPWSRGGYTEIENGQATCPTCNLRKGART